MPHTQEETAAMGNAIGMAIGKQSSNVIYADYKPKEDFTIWLAGYREKIRNAFNWNKTQDAEVNAEVLRSISGKLKSGTALNTYERLEDTTKGDYGSLVRELTQEFLDPQAKCRFIEDFGFNKRKKDQTVKEFMQEIVEDQGKYSDLTGTNKIKEGVRRFKKGLRDSKGKKNKNLQDHMRFHLFKDADLTWEKAIDMAARWEAVNDQEEDSSDKKGSSSGEEVARMDKSKGAREKSRKQKKKAVGAVGIATLAEQVATNTQEIKGLKSEVERNVAKAVEWQKETQETMKAMMQQAADGFQEIRAQLQGRQEGSSKRTVTVTEDQYRELALRAGIEFDEDFEVIPSQGGMDPASSR